MFIKIKYLFFKILNSLFYRFLLNLSIVLIRPTLKEVEGLENLPTKEGFILASNHAGSPDPFAIVVAIKKFLRKNFFKRGKKLYFIGELKIKKRIYSFFFNENCGYLLGSKEGIDRAVELLKDGNIVGIFPEGRRNNTNRISKGKKGIAFMALPSGTPVIPTACFAPTTVGFCQGLKYFFTPKKIIFGKPIRFFPKEKSRLENNNSLSRLVTDIIMLEIANLCNRDYEF